MSHLTRDKVVDEWLAEAELAVRAAQEVVEAAERELRAAQGRLVRLRAAREVAAEADAVVREHAGEAPAGTVPSVRAEQALALSWINWSRETQPWPPVLGMRPPPHPESREGLSQTADCV